MAAAAGDSAATLLRKGWDEAMSRLYLRQCTHVGRFARVHGRPRISNKGVLTLGDHVSVLSTVVPCELLVFEGASLEIGAHSFINYGTSIAATGSVRIGRHCLLGMYSIIFDNDFHQVDHRLQRPEPCPVVLEDNVWLGHRTLVLPGVTIGHDSVVGAGSVVVKDIPPRSIAVGNPARVVRSF
jgi:maltose O-acetyltransferase